MKNIKFLKICLISLLISGLGLSSCGNREETVSCFPNTRVQVDLNLNLPAYQALWNTGGWLYINEQLSGTRGLIVIRTGLHTFKVYDRNAPHICPDAATTLEVKEDIKIICPKDGAEWILLTGEPTKVAQVPPKTYNNYYDTSSNTLSIKY